MAAQRYREITIKDGLVDSDISDDDAYKLSPVEDS